MPQPEFKIPHDSINKIFREHIDLENNDRIIFSAPFGTGKTTFLKDFFNEDKDNLKEYKVVHLFPINYAVASNEDVFELIKYDIFYELLTAHREELKLEEQEFSKLLTVQSFILNDFKVLDVIKAIIKNTSKIGKSAVEIIEVLTGVIKEFELKHKELQINEFDGILKHLESLTKNKGSIIEFDEFSELIGELLVRLKFEDTVKTVLIIDDMDRMDPEHIFRLFNVFSAHYELRRNANKFGFDKVIFVCDTANIRRIFQHRYGQGVDFSGYIDKFFSIDIFKFNNREIIIEKISNLLTQIQITPGEYEHMYNLKTGNNKFRRVLHFMLVSLIDTGQIDLRSLIKIKTVKMPTKEFQPSILSGGQFCVAWEFLVLMETLKQFIGETSLLIEKIKFLSENYAQSNAFITLDGTMTIGHIYDPLVSYCIPFLNHDFFAERDVDIAKEYIMDQGLYLHYNKYHDDQFFQEKPQIFKITINESVDSAIAQLNIFQLVNNALSFCSRSNLLK
jgi:hypothetical protein